MLRRLQDRKDQRFSVKQQWQVLEEDLEAEVMVEETAAVWAVVVREVAATEVAMVAVVTAEEVMARMQESKRGSLLG